MNSSRGCPHLGKAKPAPDCLLERAPVDSDQLVPIYPVAYSVLGATMRRRTLAALALLAAAPAAAQPAPLTVFAAASLTDALRELGAQWAAKGHAAPRYSFAASSALARQIEQGAPADLFASADEQWMDWAQQRRLIAAETRKSSLGNTLVLVAPAASARPVTLQRGVNLAAILGPQGRLATGDPAHVPVGIYAQAALTWLGQWDAIAPRLARAETVRAALLLVERGEAPLGIVYATDAVLSPTVRILGSFPAESHPPVSYPFAVTKRAEGNAAARAFLAFVTGPEAAPVWQRFGFVVR
jgi:molybdate transport system substrate-binding protein